MPLITTQSARGYGWSAGSQQIPNSFESIATAVVGSNTSSVTLSSIPSGYKHLQVRISALTSSPNNDLAFRYNGDSGNNYTTHAFYGDGSSVSSFNTTGRNTVSASFSQPTGYPGVAIVDILDYGNTNKYKTSRSIWGYDNLAGADYLGMYSGLWQSTSAITSLTFFNTLTNATINQYTTIALYGIKGD